MKISNYMNNTNLIVEKNNVKVQKENKQTNEKHTRSSSSDIKFSIILLILFIKISSFWILFPL